LPVKVAEQAAFEEVIFIALSCSKLRLNPRARLASFVASIVHA
jgi:hypothetical protein